MPSGDHDPGSSKDGLALAEGFYWMAEKLMWGYEDVQKNPEEALKLYRQAASLGWSDAYIRIGEFHEHGRGGAPDAAEALAAYRRAADAGNYLALAFMAKLLSRTTHRDQADPLWEQFFSVLSRKPQVAFVSETIGGLIHDYLETCMRRGAEPNHLDVIRRHRVEVIARHQQMLEDALSPNRLSRLEQVEDWLVRHLKDEGLG